MMSLPLTNEMRDLLAKASVIGEVRAVAYDSERTTHSKPGDAIPMFGGTSLHAEMLRAFNACTTTQGQREAVDAAKRMLELARRNPGPAEGLREVGSLPWKREIAREAEKAQTTGDIKRLAKRYSISRATVYNYRNLYGESEAA